VTRALPVDPAAFVGEAIDVTVFGKDRAPTREELLREARGADGLVVLLSEAIDGAVLDALPTVRVVACVAVGHDNVDVPACTARGVWVTNTPGVLTDATADFAMALLLAVARRVGEGERMVRAGRFGGWSPTMLLGTELRGKTLGVFGKGRIGSAVALRAAAFGMDVIHCSRSGGVSFDELLERSDVISIHAPLTDETCHRFDAAAFARAKPSLLLVNTARGPIVDEAALVAALEAGRIGGAALDVYEREPEVHPGLLAREDVVLAPHLGSATRETRRRMAEIALTNAMAVLRGARPPNPVNEILP
jgi:glyoxylate reductase